MATKMKYKVIKNNTPTQDKAPYVGQITPAYELDYEDFVRGLVGEASPADAEMVGFFFAALYELIAEDMPANLNRYNLGSFTIEAHVLGSFPSEDAEFDADRNSVVVGATLAQSILDAVGDIVPARDADSITTDVRLNTIMDIASQTYTTIDGVNEFRMAGQKLYVSEPDEYVRVRNADGAVTNCTVTKTDENGQRVYAKLPSALPAGTYTLEIASHGGDASKPLTLITRKVKVLGATEPVTPTIANVRSASATQDFSYVVGEDVEITGTDLTLGAGDKVVVEFEDPSGEKRTWDASVTSASDTKIVCDGSVGFGEIPGNMYITVTVKGVTSSVMSEM